MLRKAGRVVVSAAVVALAVSALALPADAASPIRFGRIQYDSPGTDTHTSASLNGEYFTVTNTGSVTQNIKGFTVRDPKNHVYTFTSFNLGAHKSVRVHTGKGTNTATNRYWGQGSMVWNNTGDTATMKNASGVKIESCAWKKDAPGYTNC